MSLERAKMLSTQTAQISHFRNELVNSINKITEPNQDEAFIQLGSALAGMLHDGVNPSLHIINFPSYPVSIGDDVVLWAGCYDTYDVRWFLNGNAVVDIPGIVEGAGTPIIRITGATAAMSGEVQIAGIDADGNIAFSSAMVAVVE